MNDFVSVAMRLAGSVFRTQSYGSVIDLIDILSGLAGLIFLAIVLLVHELTGSAREQKSDWRADAPHANAVLPGHRKR